MNKEYKYDGMEWLDPDGNILGQEEVKEILNQQTMPYKEIAELKEYKEMWQSIAGKANLKALLDRLADAEKVIGFYNCHVSQNTVPAFKFNDDAESYIGEVPIDDYELLQEGSDSCNLFMGKLAREYQKKYEVNND